MSTNNHKPATTSDILPGTLSSEVLLTKEDPHSDNPSPSSTASPTAEHEPCSAHRASAPATNPQIQPSNNPFPLRARCGKVARLPKEIRDQLNEMLLDGVPHSQIIQKLKATFGAPAAPQSNVVALDPTDAASEPDASNSGHESRITHPSSDLSSGALLAKEGHDSSAPASDSIENQKSKIENLTSHHLTTWKKFGGYRAWLRDQQRIEECKLRHELTLDLARSAEGIASYQAAPKVAVAEICQTIVDLGPAGLKEAMQASPLNCFRLLNALARLINSGLKCEAHIHKTATAIRDGERLPATRARWERIERNLNLM
jgi:hypothetical protein